MLDLLLWSFDCRTPLGYVRIPHDLYFVFPFCLCSVNAQYKKVMRMLIFNLKEGKNPSIRDKVLNRLLPPCHVVRLTPQDFLSPEELEHRKNVGEQHLKDITIQETVIESHAFTCPK